MKLIKSCFLALSMSSLVFAGSASAWWWDDDSKKGVQEDHSGSAMGHSGSAMGSKTATDIELDLPLKGEVNIYSYRQPFLLQPILDKFTATTGIRTNVVYAKKGLIERLRQEGPNTKADLVLTVGAGRLGKMSRYDLIQPIYTYSLINNVPSTYRDPAGYWYGISLRARIIYASKDRVPPGTITRYEDLSNSAWRGKICTRSGTNSYQLGLTASMIYRHGVAKAKKWLQGVKDNLARKPQGNDRAQVKAIKEGVCDVSIGNSYYMGKMLSDPKQKTWADAVYMIFPNQYDRGAHMNITAGAVTKYAKNRSQAVLLLEYLTSDSFQEAYGSQNFEYPIRESVPWSPLLKSWGQFKKDTMSVHEIFNKHDAALRITNEIRYDQ